MAEGIFGQYLYINPAAQVIVVVFGAQTKPTGGAVIEDELFFDAVVDKLKPKLRRPYEHHKTKFHQSPSASGRFNKRGINK